MAGSTLGHLACAAGLLWNSSLPPPIFVSVHTLVSFHVGTEAKAMLTSVGQEEDSSVLPGNTDHNCSGRDGWGYMSFYKVGTPHEHVFRDFY